MKKDLIKNGLILSALFILLAIILFNGTSFWFLGMGIVVVGILILYTINH